MSNPYRSPGHQAKGVSNATNDVVVGQKLLIYSVIAYLCALPILVGANSFLEGTSENPVVTPMFGVVLCLGLLCILAAGVCACIAILRMGKTLFPGSTRYVYAIGVLIPAPLIGLIVMVVANSNASGYLKSRGYRIGFFGAKRG